ncbi:phospho-sugar mutase [Baekduia soli]|uniref:Phospho-sugar mutase n=1 Tax=Baekduia soli TaxID=496014 RepID=A0A5B8U6C3_9ACTN|nr:phospho-sugar mutase [Baekduia soli]QEC48388.1 phospho-sugar mutase [Baekduia soli]
MPSPATTVDADLAARVRAWIAGDPDPGDRAELQALLDVGDGPALADRFAAPLAFGTAGLRGPLQAGPSGMNRAVVRRAAAALAAHLGPGRRVVIGHDARHRSDVFARESAAVMAGAGLHAVLLPRALPTPVLAFAVRALAADAGVMVTASHNPPTDNGYKIYLGGPGDEGAQIVSPTDAEIEARIAAVGPVARIPLDPGFETAGEDLVTAYVTAICGLTTGDARDVLVAVTSLHGVGDETLRAAFARAGFAPPVAEPSQARPDPDFPTVAFPNPEEAGAMDRVLALGARIGADVVLANDPDADRLAVAVGDRVLTGDEVGRLLADHVLAHRPGPVATTIVSSAMLERIAEAHGVPVHRTLTGFKWLMRAAGGLVFAYEEALGYAVGPDVVRDKDGISAALLVAELAAAQRAAGRTLLDRLDDLERRHGVHATAQHVVRVQRPEQISRIMAALRAGPPAAVGPAAVERVEDLDRDGGPLPRADVLVLTLAGARIVVRPSGTEPKLKAYLEVVRPPGPDLAAQRAQAGTLLEALQEALAADLARRGG